ncbi:hypothetical protein CPC08DRAFT_226984 [Agrocybe pediades]|nr:hypothetical protein CPC08DRAFT_226984 [Agrocybe pediades]
MFPLLLHSIRPKFQSTPCTRSIRNKLAVREMRWIQVLVYGFLFVLPCELLAFRFYKQDLHITQARHEIYGPVA